MKKKKEKEKNDYYFSTQGWELCINGAIVVLFPALLFDNQNETPLTMSSYIYKGKRLFSTSDWLSTKSITGLDH